LRGTGCYWFTTDSEGAQILSPMLFAPTDGAVAVSVLASKNCESVLQVRHKLLGLIAEERYPIFFAFPFKPVFSPDGRLLAIPNPKGGRTFENCILMYRLPLGVADKDTPLWQSRDDPNDDERWLWPKRRGNGAYLHPTPIVVADNSRQAASGDRICSLSFLDDDILCMCFTRIAPEGQFSIRTARICTGKTHSVQGTGTTPLTISPPSPVRWPTRTCGDKRRIAAHRRSRLPSPLPDPPPNGADFRKLASFKSSEPEGEGRSWIAALSSDGTVSVLDTRRGIAATRWVENNPGDFDLAFSSDGKRLNIHNTLSCSYVPTFYTIDCSSDKVEDTSDAEAKTRPNRNLTRFLV